MKAISFSLSGKSACFRKPDVNQYAYFTYNNIHKPALLGMFGAILGYGGHIQLHNENREIEQKNKSIKKKAEKKLLNDGYPEFYERLKELKISIIPLAPHGYFSKKIQVFNNSVGYASREMGGNLIVREQWLEDPAWQIMILDNDTKEYEKLKTKALKLNILNNKLKPLIEGKDLIEFGLKPSKEFSKIISYCYEAQKKELFKDKTKAKNFLKDYIAHLH